MAFLSCFCLLLLTINISTKFPLNIFHLHPMFRFLLFFSGFSLFLQVNADAQFFERVYPGTGMTHVGSLDNTLDSGFIVCGSGTASVLLNIQSDGDTEWIKSDS